MALPNNWKIEEILSLTYYKKVSISLITEIVEQFDSLEELLNPPKMNDISAKFIQNELFESNIKPLEEAKKQIELCANEKVRIINLWDDEYPELLKEIHIPPVLLFIKGELQKADSVSISIVGTRNCTSYGKLITKKFAGTFAKNGVIVTSGLAYGIDTISHLSTIEDKGITYAVMASGLDRISPSMSVRNAEKIVDAGGAIISEYKCGTLATTGYFPQRNRIISGISKATLVVESGKKGGSLITAKFALDQGRDVYAVPGDIRSDKSKGTNLLIRKSIATPAISPDDILEDLGLTALIKTAKEKKTLNLSSDEQKIYDILNFEPIHIDEISNKLNMENTDVLVKLLNMEFNGVIKQLPGKYYIREC
jgi:DNA processing protein